jgi:hypothetical protein
MLPGRRTQGFSPVGRAPGVGDASFRRVGRGKVAEKLGFCRARLMREAAARGFKGKGQGLAKALTRPRLEPGISGPGGRRLIH